MIKLLGTIISLVLALGFILVCLAIVSDLVPWLQGILCLKKSESIHQSLRLPNCS